MTTRRNLSYFLGVCFILGWWTLGLRNTSPALPQALFDKKKTELKNSYPLSPLTREHLIEALKGNFSQMAFLIQAWDLDARGYEKKRLSEEKLLEAEKLGRALTLSPPKPSSRRYYPHTWAQAELLLTLLPKEEILALPKGFTSLYPLDLPVLTGELPPLILNNPSTLVLAAPYSSPKALKMLNELNASVYKAKTIFTLNDLIEEIERVAIVVERPQEGRLLALFVEAFFLNMEHRASLLPDRGKTLYLEKGIAYHIPTQKLLSGQIAKNFGLNQLFQEKEGSLWRIPLGASEILAMQPDHIVMDIDSRLLNALDPSIILGAFDLYEALK